MANAASQSIRQAKRTLRKQMALTLAQVASDNVVRQSSSITEHILRHPAFVSANNVSIYVSMEQGEVRTEELCRQTLLQGKRLYVPRFAASRVTSTAQSTVNALTNTTFDTDMRMLRVADWDDYEAMVMNKWGIREPEDVYREAEREDALDASSGGQGLDLILVPGVAFDTFGGRLGHGKGYYDRYIQRATSFASSSSSIRAAAQGPSTVALALKEQILASPERVPGDENDLEMDVIMTADGPLSVQQNEM